MPEVCGGINFDCDPPPLFPSGPIPAEDAMIPCYGINEARFYRGGEQEVSFRILEIAAADQFLELHIIEQCRVEFL